MEFGRTNLKSPVDATESLKNYKNLGTKGIRAQKAPEVVDPSIKKGNQVGRKTCRLSAVGDLGEGGASEEEAPRALTRVGNRAKHQIGVALVGGRRSSLCRQ